jgi:AAA domain
MSARDALRALQEVSSNGADGASGRHVELTPARAIQSERVRWQWRERLPQRSLSVIAGEKGLGKSLLTNARLPAEATRGALPGELEGRPIDVLVCSGEDDWRSVVKPRLMAHGADLDRVHRIRVVDGGSEAMLTLPDDVPLLEAEIERLRAAGHTVGIVVIDPIGAFLSGTTDTHRDSSVRRALAPLAAMADRLDLVVLVVMHLTKDESTRLINRISGAGAFANAARSVLVLARNPDDPEGEQGSERVLVHVGSNWGRYAATLAVRVEAREVDLDDGSRADVGYLLVTGETDINVDDLQRGRDDNGGVDVEEAILAALTCGPRPSREVKAQVVVEVECGKSTVERAARRMADADELLIESGGFPRTTTWTLKRGASDPSHSHVTDGTSSDVISEPPGDVTGGFADVTGVLASSGVTEGSLEATDATGADGAGAPTASTRSKPVPETRPEGRR